MSCNAMGMGGGIIVVGYLAVVGLYSCGPNIVVGAVGTTITGILATKDKVNKVYLEKQLAAQEGVDVGGKLNERIQLLDNDQMRHLDLCSRFAWSMIPFVGPFIAILKST